MAVLIHLNARVGDVDRDVKNLVSAAGHLQRVDQALLHVENLRSRMVPDQSQLPAIADDGLDRACKRIDTTGKEGHSIRCKDRVGQARKIELLFGRRLRSFHKGKRIAVVREKTQRFGERVLDRCGFPQVRQSYRNRKIELPAPVAPPVRESVRTARQTLVGAIDVGAEFEQIEQNIGDVAHHGSGEIPDFEIDVAGLALHVHADDVGCRFRNLKRLSTADDVKPLHGLCS